MPRLATRRPTDPAPERDTPPEGPTQAPPRPELFVPAYGGAQVWMPWVRRAVTERWHPHLSATTLLVAGVLCQFMDHRTGGGMRPGWARLIAGSRVCRSTVARHLAALRHAGLLVTVAGGTHLTHHQRRATGRIADAAVYAGMIPRPPAAKRCRTPTLGCFPKLTHRNPVTRTRTPPRRRPARPGTAAAKGYELADAFRARYPLSPVSTGITPGWLAFELRPLAVAGWTPADVAGWLDQRPLPPTIRRPLGWLRARLQGATDTEAASALAARQAEHARAEAAARRQQTALDLAAAAPPDVVRGAMADISAALATRRAARVNPAPTPADSAVAAQSAVSGASRGRWRRGAGEGTSEEALSAAAATAAVVPEVGGVGVPAVSQPGGRMER